MSRRLLAATLFPALAALAASAAPAAAQVDTTYTPVDSVVVMPGADVAVAQAADTTVLPMSPRGAFIRSMVLPGWGQSAFDSYFRGGVFFAGWAANWFMNARNYARLDNARDRYALRTDQVTDSMLVAGIPQDSIPLLLDVALETDTIAEELDQLVRAREQQREDWIAWSIFWILASGVDGYVTAHLADFPASIELEPNADRSMSLRVEVPLPRRRW